MLENVASLLIWLLLATSVVLLGWNEPLNYKLKTRAQIQAEEKALLPPPPPPPPPATPRPLNFTPTQLDQPKARVR